MDAEQTAPETIQDDTDPAARLPFDAEFVQHVRAFCDAVLTNVPELHGIAIVPLWNNQPENMPAGLLQLRNVQPPYLLSLTALLRRLAAFSAEAQADFAQQVRIVEQYALELDARVKERIEELNQLNKHTDSNEQK
jgi:hypothetical protein